MDRNYREWVEELFAEISWPHVRECPKRTADLNGDDSAHRGTEYEFGFSVPQCLALRLTLRASRATSRDGVSYLRGTRLDYGNTPGCLSRTRSRITSS